MSSYILGVLYEFVKRVLNFLNIGAVTSRDSVHIFYSAVPTGWSSANRICT